MEKLEKGMVVTGLTEEQFNELMAIEGSDCPLSYYPTMIVDADINGNLILMSVIEDPIEFEDFKNRALNTFKK